MPDMEKSTIGWDWIWLIVSAVILVVAAYSCTPTRQRPAPPTVTPLAWVTTTAEPYSTVTPTLTATDTPAPKDTATQTATAAPRPTETATLAPEATSTPKPTATPTPRTYALIHEVQPGQWLSTIAAHYYGGDWERWPEIYEMTNRAAAKFPRGCMRVIDDPDVIFPGNCLLIPIGE